MSVDRRDSSAALTGGASYPSLRGRSVFITGGGSGIGGVMTEAFATQGSLVAFVDIAEAALPGAGAEDREGRPSAALVPQDGRHRRSRPAGGDSRRGDGDGRFPRAGEQRGQRRAPQLPGRHARVLRRSHRGEPAPRVFRHPGRGAGHEEDGGGSIINFGSNSYGAKGRDMSVYTTAKSSVIGFTRGIARELGEHRIRVNVITPGWIMTERQIEQVAGRQG